LASSEIFSHLSQHIVSYQKGSGGTVTLRNGKELSVSASKKANLLAHFK